MHVVDFYLSDKHEQEGLHIRKLVQYDDDDSTELLRGYVREAMRKPVVGLLLCCS